MSHVERREHRTGVSWRVIFYENGQRQQQTFSAELHARDFAEMVKLSGERWPRGWVKGVGWATERNDGVPLFRNWATEVVTSRTAANERTRSDYLRDLNRHAYPVLGDHPIDLITRSLVALWVTGLRTQGLAPKTVKNVHNLVSTIFSEAIDAGYLVRSPTKGTLGKTVGVKTEDMTFLLVTELDLLLKHTPVHYRPLIQLLAGTGLRWSEATALTVGSVDVFDRRTLTVTRAWKRDEAGGFYIGEPKTARSRRTISLSPEVIEAILPLWSARNSSDLLFTNGSGRTVLHSNFYNRVWRPSVTRAQADGLTKQPRIHDLRHSHVAWLIGAGIPLPAIQQRLGHTSITTTIDRYGHLVPELNDAISVAIDRVLAKR